MRPVAAGSSSRADYSRLVLMTLDTEIAILSSFKTPAERKAFADDFLSWALDEKPDAETRQRATAMEKLQDYSAKQRQSKEWQKILKQLGVIK